MIDSTLPNAERGSRIRKAATSWGFGLAALFGLATSAAAAVVVNGFVPDWNQPLVEGAGAPVPAGGWAAWCAPTSGSNLAGHWDDARGVPVADGTAFPGTTVAFGAGASWKDYLADGFARPPKNGPLPPWGAPTDLGWYMDTNNGGQNLGNGFHIGTYLKDIHVGLGGFLNTIGVNWSTGTQGKAWAGGFNSAGFPAAIHGNQLSAWAEVVGEINANRTLLITWAHWNLALAGFPDLPAAPGSGDETQHGGKYYNFSIPGSDPWGNGEEWYGSGEYLLGHTVTAVGYIPMGSPDDPTGVTDWVIVHDNCAGTPRNVIVPLDIAAFNNVWVANTNAVPEPGTLVGFLAASASLLCSRRFRNRG